MSKDSFDINITDNNKNTIVAFGGLGRALTIPPFEFFNIIKDLNVNKVFVKDNTQSWYYKMGHKKIISYLGSVLKPLKGKIVFVGSSSGGFASLLFGSHLYADVVLSFAPQTFLDKDNRETHNDRRWKVRINDLYSIENEKSMNLQFLMNKGNTKTKNILFYCKNNKIDVIHANYMKDFPNTHLIPYDCDIHVIVKWLRDKRYLFDIIKKSLEVDFNEKSIDITNIFKPKS